MTPNNEMPELLQELATRVTKILQDYAEMDNDRANHIGAEIARQIADSWGGQTLYVPHGLGVFKHERDEKIWEEFNGTNHAQIARKYKISMQWVYSIVKKMREMKARDVQKELF